jgi:hypothetical protein
MRGGCAKVASAPSALPRDPPAARMNLIGPVTHLDDVPALLAEVAVADIGQSIRRRRIAGVPAAVSARTSPRGDTIMLGQC